jgi:hypothetical protein
MIHDQSHQTVHVGMIKLGDVEIECHLFTLRATTRMRTKDRETVASTTNLDHKAHLQSYLCAVKT